MRETLKTRDHQSMIAGAKELILQQIFYTAGTSIPSLIKKSSLREKVLLAFQVLNEFKCGEKVKTFSLGSDLVINNPWKLKF